MKSLSRDGRWLSFGRAFGLFILPLAAAALVTSCTVPVVSAQDGEPEPEVPEDHGLDALNTVEVPMPDDLDTYIKDTDAAILLGKSLFWDTQVGSDGVVACATCHWHAGADARTRNTLYPGAPGGAFGAETEESEMLDELADTRFNAIGRPNSVVVAEDFPTHRVMFPIREGGDDNPVIHDIPEVVGSQGVHETDFIQIVEGSPVDEGDRVDDPEYNLNGISLRQQTVRNTPTMINAVFNDRQFWDGRAQRFFNGVNPFGELDPDARVLRVGYSNTFEDKLSVIFATYPFAAEFEDVFRRFQFIVFWFLPSDFQGVEVIEPVRILIEKASLASQAVGPPLDTTEMSFIGRTFPELGRKMFSLDPLAQQEVHSEDSVLGPYANSGGNGLTGISYAQMVRDAFQDEWWSGQDLTPEGFTQMEANFSLFWGLSLMAYQATLVSDDSPFDRHMRGEDNLSESALRGLDVFVGDGKCVNCHEGPEFTGATVSAIRSSDEDEPIEFMEMQEGPEAFYDNGFYNIGVRPTLEDIGAGATHPDFGPIAFSRRRQNGEDVNQDIEVPEDARLAVLGAFKTPSLRNVELTGPYMHAGNMRTLTEVVQFYTRRADFFNENIEHLDPDVDGVDELQNNPEGIQDMVEFLKSLTDDRVRFEKAPFDHPSLVIVNGHRIEGGEALDITDDFIIPAVGQDGGDEVLAFDEIVPGESPTAVDEAEEGGDDEEEEEPEEEEDEEETTDGLTEEELLELLERLRGDG